MGSLHSVTSMNKEQTITVDLGVGDYVILYESIDLEPEAKGYSGDVLFEGEVAQFVPETGLLSFTNASEEIGRAQFVEYTSRAEGVTVLES
jgi:hypothetical protein